MTVPAFDATTSVASVLVAYALVAAGGYLLVGHRVRTHGGGTRRASTRLVGAVVAGAAAIAVTLVAGVETGVASRLELLAPGYGPDVYPTAAALLIHVGPVPACALAAYVGGGGVPTRFVRGYAVLAGPALAMLAVTPLLPSAWYLVALVGAVGGGLAAATPLFVPQLLDTRTPVPHEQHVVDAADGLAVRVVDAGPHANAMAAGVLPGLRVVFVTDALVARLPRDECAAVVAHEVGHHRRGHVPLRLVAAGAVVLPWLGVTAAEIPGAFEVGAVAAVLCVPVLFWLMRWTEHDADAYAARATDADALVRGLSRLTVDTTRGPVGRLLALHPTLSERADRVR